MQNSYQTCAWTIWYIIPIQCEKLRINHLTLLLVVTMPYACWFLWRAEYIEDFRWRLHFAIWGCVLKGCLREVCFEGPHRVWNALKTSILNIDRGYFRIPPVPGSFGTYRVGQDPSDSESNRLRVHILWFWCFHSSEVYSLDSSKMIGKFPEVLNLNRLFFQLNRFICT